MRVREGIRYLRHEPLLRSLTLFGGTSNLALTGYQSILVVFLLRETHLRTDVVGLVLALAGLGGVTGAFLARPLAARLGSARALLATKAAGGAGALLIPLATSPSRAAFVVAGGTLAAIVGLTPALWITTAMVPLASLFLFLGPVPGLRDLPSGARRDVGVR
ncbi:MAG TPA: hypothetical protein VG294_18990 [Solirubrobacteraceae bacterium]|jgi:predicted MFS family arabinose efflux permease|nr:hypothetical protein [Solirubrobacteraceae bacterium]